MQQQSKLDLEVSAGYPLLDVIPNIKDGNTVRTVINASICKDSEYVVSPSGVSETFTAGRPTPKLSNNVSASKEVLEKETNKII